MDFQLENAQAKMYCRSTVNCLEDKSLACKALTKNLGDHGKHLPSIQLQAEGVLDPVSSTRSQGYIQRILKLY